MLRQHDIYHQDGLEDWYLTFPPAQITVHNVKTGAQVQEPTLVAVTVKTSEHSEIDPYTGTTRTVTRTALDKLAAAGRAAMEYQHTPGMVVFSPFRQGQIVHYPAAELLMKTLMNQVCPKLLIPKPVICVHVQEQTTQVETQALAEAAIQAGARKVLLYSDPLSVLLDSVPRCKELQNAILIHIDPQEG